MRRSRLAAVALAFSSVTASAETITVCASGCDYTSINAAISAASDGDVIQLAAETYFEGEQIDTLGKAVTLRGVLDKAGEPVSVLDGAGTHRVLICQSGETSGTVFERLRIQHGLAIGDLYDGWGGGLYITGAPDLLSRPLIVDCVFLENEAEFGGGLAHRGSPSPRVLDSRFLQNAAYRGGGCFISGGADYEGVLFFKNQATLGGGGLFTQGGGTQVFVQCSFEENTSLAGDGGGLFAQQVSGTEFDLTVSYARFEGNEAARSGGGLYASSAGSMEFDLQIQDSEFRDNQVNVRGGAVYCTDDLLPVISGSTFCGNSLEQVYSQEWEDLGDNCTAMSCDDADLDGNPDQCNDSIDVLRVPEEFGTVNEAVLYAGNNDIIHIASGTHLVSGFIEIEGKSIVVRGETDAEGNLLTTLNGDGGQFCLYYHGQASSGSRVESLAFEACNSLNGFCSVISFIDSAASIESCLFLGNGLAGKNRGGAVELSGDGAVFQCRFVANSADFGGGIWVADGSPVIEACAFESNLAGGGGGLACDYGASPQMVDCSFSTNVAGGGGGGILSYGSPIIQGCVLRENEATSGGGIKSVPSASEYPSILNTVICGNAPDQIVGRRLDLGGNQIEDDCSVIFCPTDLNSDSSTDGEDLGIFVTQWGQISCSNFADFNGDCEVDAADLGLLFAAWGPCQ